ncbi:MAG: sigma 54-interacting transcriptional regulator [Desulfobulbaceae bacterium]|nr:sigma 54-interacting transcriptional regulator [Desulfobulbaceae bacterium]
MTLENYLFENTGKEFWKTIIDTIQEGLMIVKMDGEIVFVNKAFEKLLGYPMHELKGKSCELFQCDYCFKERANGRDKHCLLFKELRERSIECKFRHKTGRQLHLLKNATVIKNKNGDVIGGVESLIDLSKVLAKEKVINNLRKQLHYNEGFHGIIGNSMAMQQTFEFVSIAAQSDAPLIIYGESGTGKELIATAVHNMSIRSEGPFVKVNCAALNENLFESELFGHVKGSFTGAEYQRTGRFEAAHRGSIFLDEIGELPVSTQTKLLRVLQEKEIERVGDHRPIKIDVRIIAATHTNLQQRIDDNLFRADLYYRIGVIPIFIPPLRERSEDIPVLIETFIARTREKVGKSIEGITREALEILINYSWPGNVRELINIIEYAFVLCPGGSITTNHLPPNLLTGNYASTAYYYLEKKYKKNKRKLLIEALQKCGGNQTKTALLLGISRVTVWKQIKKFGISIDTKIAHRGRGDPRDSS